MRHKYITPDGHIEICLSKPFVKPMLMSLGNCYSMTVVFKFCHILPNISPNLIFSTNFGGYFDPIFALQKVHKSQKLSISATMKARFWSAILHGYECGELPTVYKTRRLDKKFWMNRWLATFHHHCYQYTASQKCHQKHSRPSDCWSAQSLGPHFCFLDPLCLPS